MEQLNIKASIKDAMVYVTQSLPIETLRQMLAKAEADKAPAVALRFGISLEDWTLTTAKVQVEIIETNIQRRQEAQNRKIVIAQPSFDLNGVVSIHKK